MQSNTEGNTFIAPAMNEYIRPKNIRRGSGINFSKIFSYGNGQEECREQLCDCGALPALIQLASMDDEATKLRCVIAFANLSCEYTIQGQMVRAAN